MEHQANIYAVAQILAIVRIAQATILVFVFPITVSTALLAITVVNLGTILINVVLSVMQNKKGLVGSSEVAKLVVVLLTLLVVFPPQPNHYQLKPPPRPQPIISPKPPAAGLLPTAPAPATSVTAAPPLLRPDPAPASPPTALVVLVNPPPYAPHPAPTQSVISLLAPGAAPAAPAALPGATGFAFKIHPPATGGNAANANLQTVAMIPKSALVAPQLMMAAAVATVEASLPTLNLPPQRQHAGSN